ncbi:hypothetical protein [Nocardioides limicola]|uniref:hypothetical protein n=1 Tax=Nocardioides limicola TaxID=2803368 RepID=UPI00193B051F|nr:hypothetical protein [Nocardioides sp. DJM-14]
MAAEIETEPAVPLLARGRIDRIRVQVGHRRRPDEPAHEHFLLDLGLGEEPQIGEDTVLTALEPLLFAGTDVRRHHSIHRHQWHTSWGAAAGALEIGLLVTTGPTTPESITASHAAVQAAFTELLEQTPHVNGGAPVSRDSALVRARAAIASAYDLDADALGLGAEEHHPAAGSWTLSLRNPNGDWFDAVVGFVGGHRGSVHVRRRQRIEVSDSVGEE